MVLGPLTSKTMSCCISLSNVDTCGGGQNRVCEEMQCLLFSTLNIQDAYTSHTKALGTVNADGRLVLVTR